MHIIASKCFVQREFRLLKDVEGQNSHIKPIVSRVVVLFKANPGDFFKSVDYRIIRRVHSFACFRHLCRITCWRNVQTLYKWILSVAPVKWWKRGALKSSAVHKAMCGQRFTSWACEFEFFVAVCVMGDKWCCALGCTQFSSTVTKHLQLTITFHLHSRVFTKQCWFTVREIWQYRDGWTVGMREHYRTETPSIRRDQVYLYKISCASCERLLLLGLYQILFTLLPLCQATLSTNFCFFSLSNIKQL